MKSAVELPRGRSRVGVFGYMYVCACDMWLAEDYMSCHCKQGSEEGACSGGKARNMRSPTLAHV
jgi:hypothetical protein